MERIITCASLYGNIKSDIDLSKWYFTVKNNFLKLGKEVDLLGISSDITFTTSKLKKARTTEKKLIKCINDNEGFEYISLYSVPDNFTQATFDFEIFSCIVFNNPSSKISFYVNRDISEIPNFYDIINEFRDFLNIEKEFIYQLSGYESPFNFETNFKKHSFKTLKIIKECS